MDEQKDRALETTTYNFKLKQLSFSHYEPTMIQNFATSVTYNIITTSWANLKIDKKTGAILVHSNSRILFYFGLGPYQDHVFGSRTHIFFSLFSTLTCNSNTFPDMKTRLPCVHIGTGAIFLRRFMFYILSFMFRFMFANICFEKNQNSKIHVMFIINIT